MNIRKRILMIISVAFLGIILLFVGNACAAVDFPADEAGISAYVKARDSVDLNDVKPVFASIEREASEYIIGTVALDLHAEEEYPHVYVSTDGWVVAYYPDDRPSSWIIPWADYSGDELSSTTLSKAAGIVCTQLGGSITGLKYFDFRYEDATKIMIIVESQRNGENFFKVRIPTSFNTYGVDWSHYNIAHHSRRNHNSKAYLNGAECSSITGTGANYDSFSGQFVNGNEHIITINANSDATGNIGLVLAYAE